MRRALLVVLAVLLSSPAALAAGRQRGARRAHRRPRTTRARLNGYVDPGCVKVNPRVVIGPVKKYIPE